MFFMMIPAFGAYKLVLKNGAVLELAKKPDLSGKQVTAETVKGKRIIFPARFVDRIATKMANEKKAAPEKPAISVKKVTREAVAMPSVETGKRKVPLVITNETVKKVVAEEVADEEAGSVKEKAVQRRRDRYAQRDVVEEDEVPVTSTDDKGRTEEDWREKFQENRELQAGALKDLKKLQSRMNAMASRRIQTDDEIEKRSLTGKMQELRKLINKAEALLQKLKESKEKLLEEARSSGALPGWYRDYED